MFKDTFIDHIKTKQNMIEKALKRGDFVGPADLQSSGNTKLARISTEYYLRESRRHRMILHNAIEVHIPNIDETVMTMKKTQPKDDRVMLETIRLVDAGARIASVPEEGFVAPLSFYDLRLPFGEMLISFIDVAGDKAGVLIYPYEKYADKLDIGIYDIEPGSYVLEYVGIKRDTFYTVTMKSVFQFESVGIMCFKGAVDIALDEELSCNFDDENRHFLTFGATVMIALLLLLECKNISLKKHDAPVAGKEREFLRLNGVPCSDDFYTLCVKIGGKEYAYGGDESTPFAKRMHLCRGHFSNYTEERPLFGKYVGRYWIPDHMRGNPELGTIEKDYLVDPTL